MEMKSLLAKLSEMEQPAATPAADTTEIKEAYINSSKDAIQVLANLRAMGKQGEHGGQVPPGFAGQVVNDLWDVITWIEANIREDVTNEAAKPDFLDVDKDGNKSEPMKKAVKDKEEKVEESIVVQADGDEAAALVGILKLAGMQPKQEEKVEEADRDPAYANTPDEKVREVGAAVPAGDDLHKQKGAYRAAAGADNPMAVQAMEGKLAKMFSDMIEG